MYSDEQIENALLPSFGGDAAIKDKAVLAWAYREVKDKLDFIGPECSAWMKRAELAERQRDESYKASEEDWDAMLARHAAERAARDKVDG